MSNEYYFEIASKNRRFVIEFPLVMFRLNKKWRLVLCNNFDRLGISMNVVSFMQYGADLK